MRAFKAVQSLFGAVQQAGLEKVLRQSVLGTVTVGAGEVSAAEQMLVHSHGAVVLASAAKQIAQCKVQLGCIGVVLYGLDKCINGLVLLLVEQKVQAFEICLGCLTVVGAHLA